MMRPSLRFRSAWSTVASLACAVLGLASPVKGAPPVSTPENIVISGTNDFAIELYDKLRTTPGNRFYSPFSIATALAMTSTGTRGATDRQIAQALHIPQDPTAHQAGFRALIAHINAGAATSDTLVTANALWLQQGDPFLPEFLKTTHDDFNAAAQSVDFLNQTDAAQRAINAWVETQTRDKIRDLLGPGDLSPLTKLVLTNAIYYKGAWLHPFAEARTEQAGVFHTADARRLKIPLMSQTETFRLFESKSLQVLELPYLGGRRTMLIALPKQIDGLPALESALSSETLATWISQMTQKSVHVTLPRFQLNEKFHLPDTLKRLGMVDAFDRDHADFSGMTGTRHLFISDVIHQAFVDVNEAGTEAAAATAVVMMPRMARAKPFPPVEFRADHPFLFLIRDQGTGALLFLGRMQDPSS